MKFFACLKKLVPFSMVIGNLELLLECCPQHLRKGTAGMTEDGNKVLDEKRQVNMEISTAGTKTKILDG